MWLEIEYYPASLFSLRTSQSTSSGAKSLFLPSPYSVKMALLNAIVTFDSLDTIEKNFKLIKDLNIAYKLPKKFVVNNCMIRILKDNDKVSKEKKKIAPFKSTVAFREYIYMHGTLTIAVEITNLSDSDVAFLKKWFLHINYFGKKGCFFQFQKFSESEDIEKKEFSFVFDGKLEPGILFKIDDIHPKATFDNVNIYSSKKALRASKIYGIPFEKVYSSKKYHFYQVIKK